MPPSALSAPNIDFDEILASLTLAVSRFQINLEAAFLDGQFKSTSGARKCLVGNDRLSYDKNQYPAQVSGGNQTFALAS